MFLDKFLNDIFYDNIELYNKFYYFVIMILVKYFDFNNENIFKIENN